MDLVAGHTNMKSLHGPRGVQAHDTARILRKKQSRTRRLCLRSLEFGPWPSTFAGRHVIGMVTDAMNSIFYEISIP